MGAIQKFRCNFRPFGRRGLSHVLSANLSNSFNLILHQLTTKNFTSAPKFGRGHVSGQSLKVSRPSTHCPTIGDEALWVLTCFALESGNVTLSFKSVTKINFNCPLGSK